MSQTRSIYQENSKWITVNGIENEDLAKLLYNRLCNRVSSDQFTWDNVGYIDDLNLKAAGPQLNLDKESLEKLRRACQLWNVDIQLKEIQSHRKFVGIFIVAAKKIIFPILRAFLKDTLRQQRAFNAAILATNLDLYEKLSVSKKQV